jgi:hypothetical protein
MMMLECVLFAAFSVSSVLGFPPSIIGNPKVIMILLGLTIL